MTFTIRTSSCDFHAQRDDSAARTILVHGFGGDLHDWDPLCVAIDGRVSVLRYDLRGFGASSSHHYEPFEHSDDLLAILEATDIHRCNLVGLSMGGGVALNFTLNHPERVDKLVLVSPQLLAWEWSDTWRTLWNEIRAHARHGSMAEAKRLFWQHPMHDTTRASAGSELLLRSIERFSGEQWIRDDHKPLLPDVERLHTLEARTLLLTGGRDLDDFQLMAALIEGSAPNVIRHEFPSCGHLITLEDPEGCAARIVEFLSEGRG